MSGTGRTVISPGSRRHWPMPPRFIWSNERWKMAAPWFGRERGPLTHRGAVITNRAGALFSVQNSANFVGVRRVPRGLTTLEHFANRAASEPLCSGPLTRCPLTIMARWISKAAFCRPTAGIFAPQTPLLIAPFGARHLEPATDNFKFLEPSPLNGTLSVNLTNNYVPATNDTFPGLERGRASAFRQLHLSVQRRNHGL